MTIIKGVTIINSSGGGAPDEKPCVWESYEASGFGQEATGSGIPELQALARSQGLRITGTAAAKFQAGSLFQFYINGAISKSRQGQPFGALLLTIIKGVTIINSSGGGAPDEKPCVWESYEASGFGQEATGSGIRELQAYLRFARMLSN